VTAGAATPRPPHLRPAFIATVALGGAIGTGAREAISLAVPPVDGVPVAILGINIVGAFLLGVLLETLLLRGPDVGRRRDLRLFLGTGVLGGFTTYSALAADSGLLLLDGRPAAGVLYAVGSVVLGVLASTLGIALARRVRGRGTTAGPAPDGGDLA
jgi:CrcB protein